MVENSSVRWLVGVGASSMAGVGDPDRGFFTRISTADSARAQYKEFLNLGVGGWVTRQMVAGLTRLPIGIDHDLVVLLGCNDLPRRNDGNAAIRTSIEAYAANLAELFPLVKGRRSLFVTSFAVSPEKTGVDSADTERYMNVAIAEAEKSGYDIWDLFRETRSIASRFWAPDGMHFGPAGHELIARGVMERLLR